MDNPCSTIPYIKVKLKGSPEGIMLWTGRAMSPSHLCAVQNRFSEQF